MTGNRTKKSRKGQVREKTIEQKLFTAVRDRGGIALKLASPGFTGLPDRLVLLPGGHVGFVEVKAPGKKPRVLQLMRLEFLSRLGFRVYVLDDPDQIDAVISGILNHPRQEAEGGLEGDRKALRGKENG